MEERDTSQPESAGRSIQPGQKTGRSTAPKHKRLVLVLSPTKATVTHLGASALRRALPRLLKASGLRVERQSFGEGAAAGLAGRDALVLSADDQHLLMLAERSGLPKEVDQRRWGTFWQPFTAACFRRFVGSDQLDSFFTGFEVLELLKYGALGVLTAEVESECSSEELASLRNARLHHKVLRAAEDLGVVETVLAFHDPQKLQELQRRWQPGHPFAALPVRDLAEYFGTQAVHYFVFVTQYCQMLSVPAIVGIVALILHFASEQHLGYSVSYSTFAQVTTPLISIWATIFIEKWRRELTTTRRELGYHEHHGRAELLVPVSEAQAKAARLKGHARHTDKVGLRHLWTISAMLLLFGITGIVIHVLLVVGEVVEGMSDNIVVQNSPLVLYIVVVEVLQRAYTRLAVWLTDNEVHSLRAGYMKSLIMKTATFQLINYHGWFLYLAFWKQDLPYLRSQLLVFFTVKQVIGNLLEVVVPMFQARGASSEEVSDTKNTQEPNKLPRSPSRYRELMKVVSGCLGSSDSIEVLAEEHHSLVEPSSFDDYLEMSVMFAALVLYFPVFPLGGVLAFLHALFENVSDSYKYCHVQRRPVPDPTDDVLVEVWLHIFESLSYFGLSSSIALIWLESGTWTGLQLVLLEHLLLLFKSYLSWSIPDCPEWLEAEEICCRESLREDAVRRGPKHCGEGGDGIAPLEMLEVRPVAVCGLQPRWGGLLQRRPVLRLKHGDATYNTKVVAEEESDASRHTGRPMSPVSAWRDSFWFSLPFTPGSDLIAEVLSEEHSMWSKRPKYVVLGSATFPSSALSGSNEGRASSILQRPLEGASTMPGAVVTLDLRRL